MTTKANANTKPAVKLEVVPSPFSKSDSARLANLLAGRAAASRLEPMLLRRIKARRKRLEALLAAVEGPQDIEDGFYRFYHESSKVTRVSGLTAEIVEELRALLPERGLHPWFVEIVTAGACEVETPARGDEWAAQMRPLLEAFFHAHFFLKLIVRHGLALKTPPTVLPSGWAAVLYLYELR